MSKAHYVVIGNGPAGEHAAYTLREKAGEDARVTLINGHPGGSYRPHLLPEFISGDISEEALYVSPLSDYGEKGIKLRAAQQVVALDPKERFVIFDHKEILSYTGAVIAVGGRPRIPEPLLAFEELMTTLKTLEDAMVWIRRLAVVDSVPMIGGDPTPLALTRALLKLNKHVVFMLNEDAFWPLRCDEALFDAVGERLTAEGVEVIDHGRIRGMTRRSENLCEVTIGDRRLEVGMIGAFFGLRPDIRFLSKSGLRMERGVLVDEYLATGFEGLYAAGDCAQVYHPEIRDYWVSIGHDNAAALGRIAALNLLGCRVPAKVSATSIFDVQGVKANTSWWTEF